MIPSFHKRKSVQINKSSIVLNLHPVFKARNIPHPNAYLIKLGISRGSANKMLKGEIVQLNFNQLTLLCTSLNCSPNDLFALREMSLPENHELNKVKQLMPKDETLSVQEWLNKKSVDEVQEILRRERQQAIVNRQKWFANRNKKRNH